MLGSFEVSLGPNLWETQGNFAIWASPVCFGVPCSQNRSHNWVLTVLILLLAVAIAFARETIFLGLDCLDCSMSCKVQTPSKKILAPNPYWLSGGSKYRNKLSTHHVFRLHILLSSLQYALILLSDFVLVLVWHRETHQAERSSASTR